MNEEALRKQALAVNYKLGNYTVYNCLHCSQQIEDYENIEDRLCENCKKEINN